MLRPPLKLDLGEETEELFRKAVEVTVEYERSSPSLLQRKLSIGYARAARLLDQLEAAGVVGPADGSKPREVLIHSFEEVFSGKDKLPKHKEEDVFAIPAKYKIPGDLKLSRGENIPWGKPFSEVINTKELNDTDNKFLFPVGFDGKEKLYTESLLNLGNLVVAGNPLSKKENFVDTVLLTYLLRYSPVSLRLILNDQTHYLDLYNGVPHLLSPVINEFDKEISALRWAMAEMDKRLKLFSQAGIRDITSFNEQSGFEAMPRILIVTFLSLPSIENTDALISLSGMGVRAGIHNIVVVDRTEGKSLPNSIKSNIPARIAFRLSSAGESNSISISGAEKLEPGEIICKPNYGSTEKLNVVFTPDVNVKEVVEAVKNSPPTDEN